MEFGGSTWNEPSIQEAHHQQSILVSRLCPFALALTWTARLIAEAPGDPPIICVLADGGWARPGRTVLSVQEVHGHAQLPLSRQAWEGHAACACRLVSMAHLVDTETDSILIRDSDPRHIELKIGIAPLRAGAADQEQHR